MKYPFAAITGQGLGVSYSSLQQVGEALPCRDFGQAGLKCFANVANGNLVVENISTKLVEMNGIVDFNYIYNSQANNVAEAWRLNIVKQFKVPFDQTVTLIESDGHETVYTLDTQHNVYKAPGLANGTPYVRHDDANHCWVWYHPGTQITEIYDEQGKLQTRSDAAGRTTTFEYDGSQQLIAVIGPTQNRYEIRRAGNDVGIYFINNGKSELLQWHHFDNLQRLKNTKTNNGYQIDYEYAGNTAELMSVTQSDGTKLSFGFQTINNQRFVTQLKAGESNELEINYDNNNNKISLVDSNKITTEVSFDQNARITEISRQQGYDTPSPTVDLTQYTYADAGQLESVVYPNGGEDRYEYDSEYGLLTDAVKPDDQLTQNIYESGSDRPKLIVKIQYLDTSYRKPLSTRYVYDNDFDQKGQHHCFLRFEILPSGRVKEYVPDLLGNPSLVRTYLRAKFDVSHLDPDVSPSLKEMQQWVSAQDPQQVSLSQFKYDSRGQVLLTQKFANIDKNGKGIVDDKMGLEYTFYDAQGGLCEHQIQQTTQKSAVTKKTFDDLHRLLNVTDAMGHVTRYEYLDEQSQVKITYPNQREEYQQYDTQGIVTDKSQTVYVSTENQTRHIAFTQDLLGRTLVTEQPDKRQVFTFYDRQHRLGFNVSATGIVTEYQHHSQHHYKTTIKYHNAIDVTKLYTIYPPYPGELPHADNLIKALKQVEDLTKDRYQYEFYNLSGRVQYQVDEKLVATEFVYDSVNRLIAKVTYNNPLINEELQQLKQGKIISRKPDFKTDRGWQYFYNEDNQRLAECDEAGYVTQYVRDASNRIVETIRYHNQSVTRRIGQDFVPPSPNAMKDAHNYYFYDARGQVIAEINSEGAYTQHIYLPNGFKQQTIKYAKKVDRIFPQPPETTKEDQITVYQYDLLDRQIEVDFPFKKGVFTQYDVMGNPILKQTRDLLKNPEAVDADSQRNTQMVYDGWSQSIFEANPFIGQLLAEIDANNHLSPEEKAAEKIKVWKTQSICHAFDKTGLKLSTTDALGNTTYFYYDQERRPVVTIDPSGCITEITLNNFNEETQRRKYDQSIATKNLIGGFVTPEFRDSLNKLQNQNKDQVSSFEYDKRGQVIQKTDAEGNISKFTYNSFKQIEKEILPVVSNNPSLTITHQYEQRGLETETIKTDGTFTQKTSHQYENIYGKETKFIDERNGIHQTERDRLGLVNKKINPLGVTTDKIEHDAFGRMSSHVDSKGEITNHKFNQQQRTETIEYPIKGATKTITNSIFEEKIKESDALGNTEMWQHAPDGQISKHSDQLGNSESNKFDLRGKKIKYIDQNQTETDFEYRANGDLIRTIKDVKGLHLETSFTPDSFGNAIFIVNSGDVVTKNKFDRKNQNIESIADYEGLNLIKTQQFNAQGKITDVRQGDRHNSNQYHKNYSIDGLNRDTGKIVDPGGKKIITQQRLDEAGDVIADIDANGNITRKYYDISGQLRFVIDPKGGIYERYYNTEGHIWYEWQYDKAVDLKTINDSTTFYQVRMQAAALKNNSLDSYTYYFYDGDENEKFKVNSLGNVKEKRYDLADREIAVVNYFSTISVDPNQLLTMTTDQLTALMQSKSNQNDNIIYKLLDGKKQERFYIDAQGFITEKCFDPKGNKIAEIKYATQLKNQADIAKLPLDQVEQNIPKDSSLDRATYYFFDGADQPKLQVEKIGDEQNNLYGVVTRFWHDQKGNLIQTCVFANQVVIPIKSDGQVDFGQLLANCLAFIPNQTVDHITTQIFDNANRKKTSTDARGHTQEFEWNAVSNLVAETKENNATWNYKYDTAKRRVQEISPEVDITTVTQENDNPNNALTATVSKDKQIIREMEHDQCGNVLSITEAKGTTQERKVSFGYDERNQCTTTTVANVNIDDAILPASLEKRPEVNVTLNSQTVFNAKNKKVAAQNRDGNWRFWVYDSEGREIYRVLENKAVIKREYDAFNKVTKVTRYANALDVDLTPYTKTGIPLSFFENQPTPSDEDREVNYQRDHRGDVTQIEYPEIFYFLSNEGNGQYGFASPKTMMHYNAFRECFYTAKLQDPENKIWSRTLKWFDCRGKNLALCNEKNEVTRNTWDSFANLIAKSEWANPTSINPDQSTTLTELDAAYVVSDQDRDYQYVYDLNNNKIIDRQLNVIVERLVLAPNTNVPSLVDLPATSIEKHYEFSPTNKIIAVTNEKNATYYKYYDALDRLIAETGVTRTSYNKKVSTPLTYYGNDAFNKSVATTRYYNGTKDPLINVLPQPYKVDSDHDQVDLKLKDNRGLTIVEQNAENNLNFITYTPERQVARTYHPLTAVTPSGNSLHIDEQRVKYDEMKKPIEVDWIRDDGTPDVNYSSYNAFSELVSEADQNGTYLNCDRNKMGEIWRDNREKGGITLKIGDLQKRNTLRAQSATKNIADKLDKIKITDVKNILDTWDYTRLERSENELDLAGTIIKKRLAAYDQKSGPDNIPLNVYVGTNYPEFGTTNINWIIPQETTVTPTFVIYPLSDPNKPIKLIKPIVPANGRCGVDVSDLPSDIYSYEITYRLNAGNLPPDQQPILYTTTGKVQFDTGETKGSFATVPIVENKNQVRLTGNVDGLTAVKVWQGENNLVAEVPAVFDSVKKAYYADLSGLDSGIYTITPVTPAQPKPTASLPITIYTSKPSTTPLSCQIDFNVGIKWLDSHIEVDWQVPPEYANCKVKFACVYVGTDNQIYVQQDTLTPGKYIKDYYDDKGHVLHCNSEFKVTPAKFFRTHFFLVLDEENEVWLRLLVNAQLPPLIKQEKPLLKAKLPNNKIIQFEEHIVDPNGDCGFITLGVSRKQVSDKLLTLKNDAKAREFLSEEILNELLAEEIVTSDIKWSFLSKDWYRKQAALDNSVGKIKDQLQNPQAEKLDPDNLIDWLQKQHFADQAQELIAQRLEVYHAYNKLRVYCQQPEIFQSYVEGLGKKSWLGCKSAMLYAQSAKISLCIWRKDDKNPQQLSLVDSYHATSPTNTIHMLYTDGFTHFNLLSLADPESVSQQKSQNLKPQEKAKQDLIQQVSFGDRNVTWITSVENPDQYQTLMYNDVSLDRQASWTGLPILGTINPPQNSSIPRGVVFDSTGFDFANYPFTLSAGKLKHRAPQDKDGLKGTFTVVQNGVIFNSDDNDNKIKSQPYRPTINYQVDRWKNQISITDSLGNTTQQLFSCRDKLIKRISPLVDVVDEHGNKTQQHPVYEWGFDLCNQDIGYLDANQNVEGYVRDEAGQVLQHVLGDGTFDACFERDIFSNSLIRYDDQANAWVMTYNRRNKLLTQTSPMKRTNAFTYDEQDNRISQSMPSGATYRYVFDIRNNVQESYQPQLQRTQYVYDHNHQLVQQKNPDGKQLFWDRDSFGNVKHHTDLQGGSYNYDYDNKMRLIGEQSVGGVHGNGCVVVKTKQPDWHYWWHRKDEYIYELESFPVQGKDLTYIYRGNRLVEVDDNSSGQVNQFTLDSEGRRIGLTLYGPNNELLRQSSAQIDALNRPTLIYDNNFVWIGEYDANDNRRHIYAYIPNVASHEGWFTTDPVGRTLFYDAVKNNDEIGLAPGRGSLFHYKSNLRQSVESLIYWQESLSYTGVATYLQSISYDLDSRVTSAVSTISDSNTQLSYTPESNTFVWSSDGDDWIQYYEQNISIWNPITRAANWNKTVKELSHFTPNGMQDSNYQEDYEANQDPWISRTSFNLDAASQIVNSQVTMAWDVTNYNDTVTVDTVGNTYAYYDSAQLWFLRAYRQNKNGTSPVAGSDLYFTPSGEIQGVNRSGQVSYYTVTFDGTVINSTDFLDLGWEGSSHLSTTSYFHTPNNELLSSYANNSGVFVIQTNYLQPISDTFPPRAPQRYVVQTGDTFASIAARFYGDSGLGPQLAVICGYSEGTDPQPGQTLSLPQLIPYRNAFSNYKPYNDFISTLIGNIYPALQTPQPKQPHHHHSFWKTLIEAAVGAIVAIVVPELLPEISPLLIGAITGALASAATQGVAIALHDQSKFMWKGLIEGAVSGLLSAGLGGIGNGAINTPEAFAQKFGEALLKNAAISMGDELIAMADGDRREFDWNEVLSNALSSTVAGFVSQAAGLNDVGINKTSMDYIKRELIVNEINGFTAGLTDQIIERKRFDIVSVEAQALGETLGQTMSNKVVEEVTKISQEIKAYKEAQQAKVERQDDNNNVPSQKPSAAKLKAAKSKSQTKAPSTNSDSDYDPDFIGGMDVDANILAVWGSGNNSTSSGLNRHGFFANSNSSSNSNTNSDATPSYGQGNTTSTSKSSTQVTQQPTSQSRLIDAENEITSQLLDRSQIFPSLKSTVYSYLADGIDKEFFQKIGDRDLELYLLTGSTQLLHEGVVMKSFGTLVSNYDAIESGYNTFKAYQTGDVKDAVGIPIQWSLGAAGGAAGDAVTGLRIGAMAESGFDIGVEFGGAIGLLGGPFAEVTVPLLAGIGGVVGAGLGAAVAMLPMAVGSFGGAQLGNAATNILYSRT